MTTAKTFADQQAATLKTIKKQAEGYTPVTLEHLTQARDTVSAEVVFITPEVARDILGKFHAPNRALSVASKDAYLSDMIRGRWEMNGETIAFDTTGKLIQGQHRMAALADAANKMKGFPGLPFIAVFGLPRKVQETMDAGRKRSVADQLNINQTGGDKLGTKIVSALRALYILGNAGSGGKLGGGKLTNAMLMDIFKHHKEIVSSVRAIYAQGDAELQITVRPAVVTAIHYIANNLLGETEEEKADFSAKADAFVQVLRTGVPTEGYEGQDPAHALYTRWNQMLATGKRPSENDALKLVAYAWGLYAEGRPATPKAFAKVPVVLEPVGITKTDVTGEIVDLPTSSQPAAEVKTEEAPKGGKKLGDAGFKLANGMTQKKGETEAQTIARYKAADEATKAKAKGKTAKVKGGAEQPTTGDHQPPQSEVPVEAAA